MKLPRLAALFGFTVLLVGMTRLPFFPTHLFSFDSVNLALSIAHFDPTLHPGIPPSFWKHGSSIFCLATPNERSRCSPC
jgi:hypothetical protein